METNLKLISQKRNLVSNHFPIKLYPNLSIYLSIYLSVLISNNSHVYHYMFIPAYTQTLFTFFHQFCISFLCFRYHLFLKSVKITQDEDVHFWKLHVFQNFLNADRLAELLHVLFHSVTLTTHSFTNKSYRIQLYLLKDNMIIYHLA